MLAQFPVTADSWFSWLGCAAAAIIILERTLSFYRTHMREQPRPSETYATKPELAQLDKKIGDVDVDVRKLRGEIVSNGETRRQSIEGKVEAVRKELSGDIDKVNDRLDKFHDRLDDILGAVGKLDGRSEK